MINSTFKLEQELLEQGYEIVIGVDEAGKGPLAGPVVAAAAVLKFPATTFSLFLKEKNLEGEAVKKNLDLIRDSKMLSEKQREGLYSFILENFYVGVGICDHKTIDRMNIFQAGFLAIKKALSDLKLKNKEMQNSKAIILLDGRSEIPNFSGEQKAIVRGDKLIKSISAASVIAKVTRDRIMLEMHQKYPEYCFDKHKGYGTKLHMDMLQKHGPCNIHRQSFGPVSLSCQRRDKLAKNKNK